MQRILKKLGCLWCFRSQLIAPYLIKTQSCMWILANKSKVQKTHKIAREKTLICLPTSWILYVLDNTSQEWTWFFFFQLSHLSMYTTINSGSITKSMNIKGFAKTSSNLSLHLFYVNHPMHDETSKWDTKRIRWLVCDHQWRTHLDLL